MTRTEQYRADAKLRWPDQKGLYCYVTNAEYAEAFQSGVFPRTAALTRQAAYKASVAAKFAQANGESDPYAEPVPAAEPKLVNHRICSTCGQSQTEQSNGRYLHDATQLYTCPIREETSPTMTDYSINPQTQRRKKAHTCKYCGAGPVFFHEHKPSQWILVHRDGTPCSARCAEKMGYTQETEPEEAHEEEVSEVIPPTPELAPAPPSSPSYADKPKTRAELIAELLTAPATLDEEQVRSIIRQELQKENRVTIDLRIQINDLPVVDCREQHERFNILVTLLSARIPTMLVGPAGSGKTTACHKAAEQIGNDFRMIACGPIPQEASLIGYMDAKGEYVRTPLRDAFEHGGVFLFDEIDAAHPGTIVKLNALLANSVYSFPDGATLPRHEDFIPVAAANTFGTGADRQYVGRNQLDSATLDRFFVLEWPYDWAFCNQLAGLPSDRKPYDLQPSGYTQAAWVAKVQKISAYIASKAIRHVVGPRAALYGVKLLDALNRELLDDGLLYKGLSAVQRAEIEGAVR